MEKEFNVKDYEGKFLKSKKCEHKYNLYEKGHIKSIFYCEKCLDIQKVDINQRIKF